MKDTMTNCSESRERLPLYVGGELDAVDAARVQGHLSQCSSCSREEQALQGARELFRDTVRAPASLFSDLNLWTGVRASMLSEGLLSPAHSEQNQWELRPVASAAPRMSLLRTVATFAAAAAVIAMASLAGSGLLSPGGESDERAPRLADRGMADRGAMSTDAPPALASLEGEAQMRPLLPGEASLSQHSRMLRPLLQPNPYLESFPVDPGVQSGSSLAAYQNMVSPSANFIIELR